LEATRQEFDLRAGRTFLRPEDAGGFQVRDVHVAGDAYLDVPQRPTQRVERAQATVGHSRSTHADDRLARAGANRGANEFAGTARAGAQWVVRTVEERQSARGRALDHGSTITQHCPVGIDSLAERAGHPSSLSSSARGREHDVERSLAAIGEWDLANLVARRTEPVSHRRGRRGRVEGATELVGARHGDHGE